MHFIEWYEILSASILYLFVNVVNSKHDWCSLCLGDMYFKINKGNTGYLLDDDTTVFVVFVELNSC